MGLYRGVWGYIGGCMGLYRGVWGYIGGVWGYIPLGVESPPKPKILYESLCCYIGKESIYGVTIVRLYAVILGDL